MNIPHITIPGSFSKHHPPLDTFWKCKNLAENRYYSCVRWCGWSDSYVESDETRKNDNLESSFLTEFFGVKSHGPAIAVDEVLSKPKFRAEVIEFRYRFLSSLTQTRHSTIIQLHEMDICLVDLTWQALRLGFGVLSLRWPLATLIRSARIRFEDWWTRITLLVRTSFPIQCWISAARAAIVIDSYMQPSQGRSNLCMRKEKLRRLSNTQRSKQEEIRDSEVVRQCYEGWEVQTASFLISPFPLTLPLTTKTTNQTWRQQITWSSTIPTTLPCHNQLFARANPRLWTRCILDRGNPRRTVRSCCCRFWCWQSVKSLPCSIWESVNTNLRKQTWSHLDAMSHATYQPLRQYVVVWYLWCRYHVCRSGYRKHILSVPKAFAFMISLRTCITIGHFVMLYTGDLHRSSDILFTDCVYRSPT